MVEDVILNKAEAAYGLLSHQIGEKLADSVYSEEILTEEEIVSKAKTIIEKAARLPKDNKQIRETARSLVTIIKSSQEYKDLVDVIKIIKDYSSKDPERAKALVEAFENNFGYLKEIEKELGMDAVSNSYYEETFGKNRRKH